MSKSKLVFIENVKGVDEPEYVNLRDRAHCVYIKI